MQVNDETGNTAGRQASTELTLRMTAKTRTSRAWFLIVSFILILTLLLIFILQNLGEISLKFFNLQWQIPIGIAMLLALVTGGLLVALFGTARVVQLRHKLGHSNTRIAQ